MQPLPLNNNDHFVGKFWMSSRSSLSQFKSNCKFLQWLNGQLNSQQKIFLRACKHGSHHIGLLLHALPRSDIKVFVKQHLCSQLHSDLPDFHLEVKKLYRKHQQIRAYAIVLHTDNGANELADALARLSLLQRACASSPTVSGMQSLLQRNPTTYSVTPHIVKIRELFSSGGLTPLQSQFLTHRFLSVIVSKT